MQNVEHNDIHIYRYKCVDGVITKKEFILKYEGTAVFQSKFYRAHEMNGALSYPTFVVHDTKLNQFRASVCYFTEEKDDEVLAYYKNRYEAVKQKAEKDLLRANKALSALSIVEEVSYAGDDR